MDESAVHVGVTVRFYAELNDHLPPERRYRRYSISLAAPLSVAELLRREGVPLAEVDLVLVNGRSEGGERFLADGDAVSVYPVFETFDVTPLVRLRPRPLRQVKFVLDVHLGKLAALLRMLGFDAAYSGTYSDSMLVSLSRCENRVLLSRDRRLVEGGGLTRAHLVRNERPLLQLDEVVARFDLAGSFAPFTRCLPCNRLLVPADKNDILGRLPERIRTSFHEFARCPGCDRLYWQGSHYEKMRALVEKLRRRHSRQVFPER